jgi:hypothetical protein
LVVVLLALVVGFVAGLFVGGQVLDDTVNVHMRVSAGYGVATQVVILRQLREGKTESATSLLEGMLESDIIALGAAIDVSPKVRAEDVKVIQMACEYRERFPRKSDNVEIDEAVAKVLNRFPKPQNSCQTVV